MRRNSLRHGTNTSAAPKPARATNVRFTETELIVDLDDGRSLHVPLSWFPRLVHGTPEERKNWRLIGNGEGIHWPDLDEDIEVAHLLQGLPSLESARSFQSWLEKRKAR